jgi:hypothetical protein
VYSQQYNPSLLAIPLPKAGKKENGRRGIRIGNVCNINIIIDIYEHPWRVARLDFRSLFTVQTASEAKNEARSINMFLKIGMKWKSICPNMECSWES